MEVVVLVLALLNLILLAGVLALITRLDEKIKDLLAFSKESDEKIKESLSLIKIADQNNSLTKDNARLLLRHKEYKQMLSIIMETLQEDTSFIRGTFFSRFATVPEYQDLNSQIVAYETRLEAIKNTLREYRMIETYDDNE